MLSPKIQSPSEEAMNADFTFKPTRRDDLRAHWLADETQIVQGLMPLAQLTPEMDSKISRLAQKLILVSRENYRKQGGMDAFLHEYSLSSQEGIVLMCLAEALLRIPDPDTADRLIQDKLGHADWATHLGQSHSMFVNASTWGLMLTGRWVALDPETRDMRTVFNRLLQRSGEPFIRKVLKEAMQLVARQFVMGRTIEEALKRSNDNEQRRFLYSFDLLGEAALTETDAQRYLQGYEHALSTIAAQLPTPANDTLTVPLDRPGISIKLSALHPRFETLQRVRVQYELIPTVIALCEQAKLANIGVTFDAEESDRLELQLDVFEAVFKHPSFREWSGIGIAVQAYQKRALPLLQWLTTLAKEYGKVIMVRLVKGAYWDTEIKRAQEAGLDSYPVFTRKASTDLSYLACARYLSQQSKHLYAQFATHNAYTLAAVIVVMGPDRLFELQSLYGMGRPIYSALHDDLRHRNLPVRIYAPVGSHRELLPYLVRRLIENGANTSFLNRFADPQANITALITSPTETLKKYDSIPHPQIPTPPNLFGADRRNSRGTHLHDPKVVAHLETLLARSGKTTAKVGCLINGKFKGTTLRTLLSPGNRDEVLGTVLEAGAEEVEAALVSATEAVPLWQHTPATRRAELFEKAAVALEKQQDAFFAWLVHEGGKTIPDALAEIRETVDYCYYYAQQVRLRFGNAIHLRGPTGELNELQLHGRGVFLCISPWNFPLAIFAGQILAALGAGNCVIAKPAQQTPGVAFQFVRLLHEIGIPKNAVHVLPGPGAELGKLLLSDPRIHGVAFTGSTRTATWINRALADRCGAIIPLIAETGGINTLIADSSAVPEQLVKDVVASAFNSAGQRCSALRALFLPDTIAERVIELLTGAVRELAIGSPQYTQNDLGPLIDEAAWARVQAHNTRLSEANKKIIAIDAAALKNQGFYVGPAVFELSSLDELPEEIFGPVLHIIRYRSRDLDAVVAQINRSGYGLTLGIHSRIESTVRTIIKQARVGNIYVNRNMIGAVVGVQPFGGEGLSGTGPKAGGPHYLLRFATERTLSVNTAAVGGNTSLLSLSDD